MLKSIVQCCELPRRRPESIFLLAVSVRPALLAFVPVHVRKGFALMTAASAKGITLWLRLLINSACIDCVNCMYARRDDLKSSCEMHRDQRFMTPYSRQVETMLREEFPLIVSPSVRYLWHSSICDRLSKGKIGFEYVLEAALLVSNLLRYELLVAAVDSSLGLAPPLEDFPFAPLQNAMGHAVRIWKHDSTAHPFLARLQILPLPI
jgi:hypothetical protein